MSFFRHRYRRPLVIAGIYAGIIAASYYLAYEVRFDFLVPYSYQTDRLRYIWFVLALKLAALFAAGQLGSMLTYFGVPDLLKLVWTMALSSAVLFLLRLPGFSFFLPPRGVLLIDFLLSLGGLCFIRLAARLYRERIALHRKAAAGTRQQRIAIVGAGDAGATLASEFINAPSRGFKPVAFFDDDAGKHGKDVHGVPVIDRPEALEGMMADLEISKIIIAMPRASAKRVREVVQIATHLELKVETLPSLQELAAGQVRVSRVRPVEVQDLLGREPVNLDSTSIQRLVQDRVVMVTGAGGSIGSEICRQIAALRPKRLLMVDQAEGSLFTIEQELNEIVAGAAILPLVANILDLKRMEFIFDRYHPELVFHAAAHKHVFMMERQPAEAISNNVLGTRRLARLASDRGTAEFVFISTDKAINPTSVMGATKRLAEMQILATQSIATNVTRFMAVRFGNVLGSSGSVIPIFKRQIANGGPVTVTHPDVTRYFMTIPEAVGLVLQSAVLGRGGEIFVLDMGQPVKILDLARQMIVLSGLKPEEDIEIKFTGLKPGEKLYEELRHHSERLSPTAHPRIMRFIAEGAIHESDLPEIERQLYSLGSNDLKLALKRFVPEYDPYLD